MPRPPKMEIFLEIAESISRLSTCSRRSVGCVLTNKLGHIIGTGYNGVGRGLPHCIDTPCSGAFLASGTGLDKCEATHAEQNALLQCRDVQEIHTAYVTCSPCMHCTKLFLNTGVKEVYTFQVYDSNAVAYLMDNGVMVHFVQRNWE